MGYSYAYFNSFTLDLYSIFFTVQLSLTFYWALPPCSETWIRSLSNSDTDPDSTISGFVEWMRFLIYHLRLVNTCPTLFAHLNQDLQCKLFVFFFQVLDLGISPCNFDLNRLNLVLPLLNFALFNFLSGLLIGLNVNFQLSFYWFFVKAWKFGHGCHCLMTFQEMMQ